jgi:hypothetical protein
MYTELPEYTAASKKKQTMKQQKGKTGVKDTIFDPGTQYHSRDCLTASDSFLNFNYRTLLYQRW